MAGQRYRAGRGLSLSRRTMLRATLIAGAGVGGGALVGCTSGRAVTKSGGSTAAGATRPAQAGGILNWPQSSEIPSLDPHTHAGPVANAAIYAALSTPFRFKIGSDPKVTEDHVLENNIATGAESPDAQTWTVRLRGDVKFHNLPPVNGHALEAEDIKATYERVFALPNSAISGPLSMIDPHQIETPSPDTVVFKLKYPYAPFAHTLASPNYSEILPREVLAPAYDPAKQVIGSGPFIWDSYTPDVGIILKKNPEYFAPSTPHIDGVHLAVVPDPVQQMAQFTAGHLDYLVVGDKDLDSAKKSNPTANVITATNGGTNIMYFQLGDPAGAFRDVRLRRAVSMAIDRDAIGKVIYNNEYQPFFSVKTFMGKWALTMDEIESGQRQYYTFDLASAKKLLDEAGGSSLQIKLAYYTGGGGADSAYVSAAQTIYNMLKQLPWQVTLVNIDYSKDFIGGGKGWRYGNFPNDAILVGGIAPFGEVDEYLFGYYHSKSTANQEHLKDVQLDGMIDKARTIVDEEARRKAYLEVQNYIAGQMYSVAGMPAGTDHTFVQSRVQNFDYLFADGNFGQAWSGLWLNK